MSTENNETVRDMGIVYSFAIFILASIALYLETKYLIPFLSNKTGQETILFWFIVAGIGIFLPLIILAEVILKSEGYRLNKNTWNVRLRFKRMTMGDWLWSGGALLVIGILS